MYDIIKNLNNSPLFQLSLSSKELFHSNFIFWICNEYPKIFGELLIDEFVIDKLTSKEIKKVSRESKNIDLTIEFENDFSLIVENKVKSVPNRNQLVSYKNKIKTNSEFILLSLLKPNFNLNEINWKFISYERLSKIITELVSRIRESRKPESEKDFYNEYLLNDYAQFINNLSKLKDYLVLNAKEDQYNFYGKDFESLKKIRLHDIYLKHKYYQLTFAIIKYMSKSENNLEIQFGTRYNHNLNKGKIVVSSRLVNGKGVINIDYSKKEDIIYGIMLDGLRYNHYIYVWGQRESKIRDIGTELRQSKLWFQFSFLSSDAESYPKNGKDFNQFGKNLIYRSAKLNDSLSLNELIMRIENDILKMIEIK